jgi:hypothetical protein
MSTLTYQYDLVEVFSIFDDFAKMLGLKPKVGRKPKLNLAKAATISLIGSFEYSIRTWKGLYKLLNLKFRLEFNLPDYKNFIEAMNKAAPTLLIFNKQPAADK